MANICFIDAETRSPTDVTVIGAYPYARHPETDCLVWGYAFDDDDFGDVWSPVWAWVGTVPATNTHNNLRTHIASGGKLVAWNAAFDRHVYEAVMPSKYGWPHTKPEQWLCAQAQAEANNLPGGLGKACKTLGTQYKKDTKGPGLIKRLSNGTRDSFDRDAKHDDMALFRAYCLRDVKAMRDVWQYTRPLTQAEWDEYHVSERINDRGVAVDVEFAYAAAQFAAAEREELDERLAKLLRSTGEEPFSVNNHTRKARWLYHELVGNDELQSIVERPDANTGKKRYSCDRSTREAVLELLTQSQYRECYDEDDLERIEEFLEIIEAGNSAAARKFAAIAAHGSLDNRVHGSYSYNGAGQTGRFSSRGVQTHNMIRAVVDEDNSDRALDAIDDIVAGVDAQTLREKYELPVSRLLARLTRPTFIAPEGRMLVWGDWAQIEARVLPWLADSTGSWLKLKLFESGRDVYKHAASSIYRKPPDDIDSTERQIGKVAELALGFGGAVGAFKAMGRGYGVIVPDEIAQEIVDAWRKENYWAPAFWRELWEAAMNAFKHPGTWYRAGRVHYGYSHALMRGTLICRLPDDRWIVYPQFKHEQGMRTIEDENGNEREIPCVRTSYVKGFGSGSARVDLWYGVLAENITQGTAASILRNALTSLDTRKCVETVLHTHDEIVCECFEEDVMEADALLENAMTFNPVWAEGLPLECEIKSGPYYTK